MVLNRQDQSQSKSYLKEHVNPVCACVFWKEWFPCTGLFLFATHLTEQRCLNQRHDSGKELTHKLLLLASTFFDPRCNAVKEILPSEFYRWGNWVLHEGSRVAQLGSVCLQRLFSALHTTRPRQGLLWREVSENPYHPSGVCFSQHTCYLTWGHGCDYNSWSRRISSCVSRSGSVSSSSPHTHRGCPGWSLCGTYSTRGRRVFPHIPARWHREVRRSGSGRWVCCGLVICPLLCSSLDRRPSRDLCEHKGVVICVL